MTVVSWPAAGAGAAARGASWAPQAAVFLTSFLVYLAGAGWVQANGYVNDGALRLWADVLMSWQSPDFAKDRLSIIYPQLRYYLALAFYGVTRSGSSAGLSVFAALIGGAVALIWFNHLRRAGWGAPGALIVLALIALNPLALWAVTRGGGEVLALLGFTWLAFALRALREDPGFRAEVSLAGVLAAFFFLDTGFVYLGLALLPVLVLFAPPAMLMQTPSAFFVIMLLPLTAAVGAFFYVSWVFSGDWLALARDPGSAIYGAWSQATEIAWLRRWGGAFAEPLPEIAMMAVLCAPLVAVAVLARPPAGASRRVMAVLALVPVVAAAWATSAQFISHPVDYLHLLLVPAVLAAARLRRTGSRMLQAAAVALLVAGIPGAGIVLTSWPSPDTQTWQRALLGEATNPAHVGERALAGFLDQGPATMIDDRVGYPVLVARNSAAGLVLPATDAFKLTVTLNRLSAPQVAVPDPDRRGAEHDQIAQNFPSLYEDGAIGYRLVYDRLGWRVYRRNDL